MVELIAKWSMADVFVVAILIAVLAAKASTTTATGSDAAPALIAFAAVFGPGFFWFAACCLFSRLNELRCECVHHLRTKR